MTCVTRSEKSLVRALVLAESLKRVQTSKRLAVIITTVVGKPEIESLHCAFDDVFYLNDNLILPPSNSPGNGINGADELRAKIFAFSFEVYDKCIFISSDTIFLENCDSLFEGNDLRVSFKGESDNLFVFSPKWAICKFLREKYEQSRSNVKNGAWKTFIMKCMQVWMKNNENEDFRKDHLELPVVKFSMKTGRTVGTMSFDGLPQVVQFVDGDMSDIEFVARLKQFNSKKENLELINQVLK